jgi:hypothetical protein
MADMIIVLCFSAVVVGTTMFVVVDAVMDLIDSVKNRRKARKERKAKEQEKSEAQEA